MKLITLTSEYGNPIMVNPEYIVFMEQYQNRTDDPKLTKISLRDANQVVCRETQIQIRTKVYSMIDNDTLQTVCGIENTLMT